ncbi:hypothetical protein G7011_00890 [Pseudomonas plecoglossicida]|nr:hypothetical protein [Pseudomonas plecoglossicida]
MGSRAQNLRKMRAKLSGYFADIQVGVDFGPHHILVPLLVVPGHAFGRMPGNLLTVLPGSRVQVKGEGAHFMKPWHLFLFEVAITPSGIPRIFESSREKPLVDLRPVIFPLSLFLPFWPATHQVWRQNIISASRRATV